MTFTQFVKECAKGVKDYYYSTWTPNDGLKRKIEIWFRDFTTGIDNLLTWFPIIWSDRYWDSYYLFKIMKKKLTLMEKNIRENDIHVDAAEDANKILICINCLDRLIKDEYREMAFEDHDKKWGKLRWKFEPIENRNGLSQMLFSRKYAITDEEREQEIEESKKCWEYADTLQKNDLNTLFTVMEKEVLKWWD